MKKEMAKRQAGSSSIQDVEMADDELSDEELEGVTAAGVIQGGTGNETLCGYGENSLLMGGGGQDMFDGGDGDDLIQGGNCGEVDTAYGGEGNDKYVWNPMNSGRDFFDGGPGKDSVELDLSGSGFSSVQGAFEGGYLNVQIEGHPNYVPEYDDKGNMVLPEGANGVILGPSGQEMTFRGLEGIGVLTDEDYAPYSPPADPLW